MKKKIFTTFGFGLIIGALFFGGYFVYAAAIQEKVGLYLLDRTTPSMLWREWKTMNLVGGGTNFDHIAAVGPIMLSNLSGKAIGQGTVGFDGMTPDEGIQAVGGMLFDGTDWNHPRDATIGGGVGPTGLPAIAQYVWNGATWDRDTGGGGVSVFGDAVADDAANISARGAYSFNGTTWDRVRDATALTGGAIDQSTPGINLNMATLRDSGTVKFVAIRGLSIADSTANATNGVAYNVPLSTWSVTHSPAVATQAIASKAADATVHHIATTVTVCLAAGGTAQTPVLIHLRDGATGAGTIIRSWAISAPINSSDCNGISGLSMAGTANTAMTIEFAAAGVAASQQTVTLTGFSVPVL